MSRTAGSFAYSLQAGKALLVSGRTESAEKLIAEDHRQHYQDYGHHNQADPLKDWTGDWGLDWVLRCPVMPGVG